MGNAHLIFMKTLLGKTTCITLSAVAFFFVSPKYMVAQTTITTVTETTTVPATPAEIQAQELALKQKQLELEKAKLVQEQSQDLNVKKAELEVEIKREQNRVVPGIGTKDFHAMLRSFDKVSNPCTT